MLKSARIQTTLPAQDLSRARTFYATKLGLEPVEERPGGLVYECSGSRFLLFPSQGKPSGTHTQIGFAVDNIVAEVSELKRRGLTFEEYDFPGNHRIEQGRLVQGQRRKSSRRRSNVIGAEGGRTQESAVR